MPLSETYWSTPNAGSARVDVTSVGPYSLEKALIAYATRKVSLLQWSTMPAFQLLDGVITAHATAAELASPNYPTSTELDAAVNFCIAHHFTSDILSWGATQIIGSTYWAVTCQINGGIGATAAEVGSVVLALEQLMYYCSCVEDPPTVDFEEWLTVPSLNVDWAVLGVPDCPMIFGLDDYFPTEEAASLEYTRLQAIWTSNTPGA